MEVVSFLEIFKKLPESLQDLILSLENVPQSPKWHPEGDVLTHTIIVYNRAILDGDHILSIASLFHDLGKMARTKKNKKGQWAAPGHEQESYNIAKKYKDTIVDLVDNEDKIVFEVVKEHMKIKQIDNMRETKRRVLKDSPYYHALLKFTEYDSMRNVSKREIDIAEATINKIKNK